MFLPSVDLRTDFKRWISFLYIEKKAKPLERLVWGCLCNLILIDGMMSWSFDCISCSDISNGSDEMNPFLMEGL